MGARLILEGVRQLSDGIWYAPSTLRNITFARILEKKLDGPSILLTWNSNFDPDLEALYISLDDDLIMIEGNMDNMLIINPREVLIYFLDQSSEDYEECKKDNLISDRDFLYEAKTKFAEAPDLFDILSYFIREIRKHIPGRLYKGEYGRWVNKTSEDGNVFAIVIQPRDRSFVVHVKGNPERFSSQLLEIKPDRTSYSRFKVCTRSQIQEAIRITLQSARAYGVWKDKNENHNS